MRSADGESWESAALREHILGGLAVWQGALYMASLTDGGIYCMDAPGQARAIASRKDIGLPAMPVEYFCLFDLGADGLLCIADGERFFCALYDGANWITREAPGQFSSPRRKIEHLAPYVYCAANGRLFFLDTRRFAEPGVCCTELEVYHIAAHNGELFAATDDGIRRVARAGDAHTLIPVCEQPWKGRVCHFFFDEYGNAIVACSSRTFISGERMQSWMGCETPFIDYLGIMAVFENRILATGRDPDADIPLRSGWCIWDR